VQVLQHLFLSCSLLVTANFNYLQAPKPIVKATSQKSILALLGQLRESFDDGATLSYEWRLSQLNAIRALCKENEPVIYEVRII